MQLKTSVIKGGLHLSLGQAAIQASSFLRNIFLARLISPADFGIAAIFGITLQMIEMLSNVSAEMFLIQSADGDKERLQATAQFFRAARGTVNGLVILLLAGPIARLFGVPQATWAFRCLGLLPLLRGLYHLDMSRLQRSLRFAPTAIADAGSSWFATLVAVPLAFWFRDYSAMLWSLIIQVSAATIVSHILAERRYAWAWDSGYWQRMVSFGWPLMINGILMFGIFEGDRLIIGSAERLFPRSSYDLSDLGIYSATFSLTMAPTQFVANICSSLFLPLLSRTQGMPDQFRRRYRACSQAACLAAAIISIFFITAGGRLVAVVYGSKYATGGRIIGWLAAMWALRIIRVAPTLAAMSLGDTKNTMLSNCVRTFALVGMAGASAIGAPLVWIAISGFSGELLALAVSVWRLHRKSGIPASLCAKPIAAAAAGMLVASFSAWGLGASLVATIASCLGCILLVTAGMLAAFRTLRHDVWFSLSKPSTNSALGM